MLRKGGFVRRGTGRAEQFAALPRRTKKIAAGGRFASRGRADNDARCVFCGNAGGRFASRGRADDGARVFCGNAGERTTSGSRVWGSPERVPEDRRRSERQQGPHVWRR